MHHHEVDRYVRPREHVYRIAAHRIVGVASFQRINGWNDRRIIIHDEGLVLAVHRHQLAAPDISAAHQW